MADFVEVIKQFKRMCKTNRNDCRECFFDGRTCESYFLVQPKESEKIIIDWAIEHPVMTNRDKFKEIFGDILEDSIGLYGCIGFKCNADCETCTLPDFWEREYKEPKERENG